MKRPFAKVVDEHAKMVLRVCRMVLGPQEAEDAWSETFLAALRAWPELPEDANVEAWLVTIAHRKAIDAVRSRQRAPLPTGDPPEQPSTIGIPDERDAELWTAVQRLPDKQRRAVAYHYVAGLPYAEVAAALGGTPEAARRAAADGIRSLRLSYQAAADRQE